MAHGTCRTGLKELGPTNITGQTKPDLKDAVEWIRRAAESGYADAQCELGHAFEEGRGLPKNVAEAARWYRKAADQGNASAQTAIGRLTELGEGAVANLTEALGWYRKAAEQGHAEGQYRLAQLHAKGAAGQQHFAEAANWYRRSAEQGYAAAQVALGSLYMLGLGVLQDYVQAHMWLNLAAAKLPAGRELDQALELRNRVAKLLTPAALVEAQRLARDWDVRYQRSTSISLDPASLAMEERWDTDNNS